MPIKDASGDVVGVAQVINKLNGERFTENDEKVSKMVPHKLITFLFFSYHATCNTDLGSALNIDVF